MISGLITSALLLLFIGGWVWAWSPKRKPAFEAAACLPLADDAIEDHATSSAKESSP